MRNSFIELIVFAILLGFSNYSYHCIRHYLALSFKVKNTSLVVNIMFFGLVGKSKKFELNESLLYQTLNSNINFKKLSDLDEFNSKFFRL